MDRLAGEAIPRSQRGAVAVGDVVASGAAVDDRAAVEDRGATEDRAAVTDGLTEADGPADADRAAEIEGSVVVRSAVAAGACDPDIVAEVGASVGAWVEVLTSGPGPGPNGPLSAGHKG